MEKLSHIKRCVCVCMVCAAMMTAAGCGDGGESGNENISGNDADKGNDVTVSAAENTAPEDTPSETDAQTEEDTSLSDDSEVREVSFDTSENAFGEDVEMGELLTKAAVLCSTEHYSETTTVYSDIPDITYDSITATDGSSYYITNTEVREDGFAADNIYFYDAENKKSYMIEKKLGLYGLTDTLTSTDTVVDVFNKRLDRTYTHIPEDTGSSKVEEYTYAGEMFIVVYDFWFGEDDTLEKYTACYTVEGEDDIIETVTFKTLTKEFDSSLLDFKKAAKDCTDFDSLDKEKKTALCNELCDKYGITADDIHSLDIKTEDLGTISLPLFVKLIYTFAK